MKVIERIVESEGSPSQSNDLWLQPQGGNVSLKYFHNGKWTTITGGDAHVVSSDDVETIVSLTQAEFDNIQDKDEKTLYIIPDTGKLALGSDMITTADNLVEITYSELKALRDAEKLVPGRYYRITDYVTKTTQTDTRSAGHQFDVIVRADSVNTLNDDAWGIQHDGDTHFANSNLSAWELKYCLDNDTTRFAWADATNGTGVIYHMKDEWNNECPYDFKNIQFKRYKVTACPKLTNMVDQYAMTGITGITVDTANPYWVYTFSMIDLIDDDGAHDVSVEQHKYMRYYPHLVCNNKMGVHVDASYYKLPNNVFVTDTDLCNIEYDEDFHGYYYNTLGNDCTNNTFGDYCSSNKFGDDCNGNTFGYSCYYNTFGNYCRGNYFVSSAYNTFMENCSSNAFYGCSYNTFKNDCDNNTFAYGCQYNTFGNYCIGNTFGNYCQYNTFGNYCYYITFGQYCKYNTFGNHCLNIKFGDGSITKNYYYNITVDSNNQYIYLYCSQTTSDSYVYKNIYIHSGVNETSTWKTITDSNVGQSFLTEYLPENSQTISV